MTRANVHVSHHQMLAIEPEGSQDYPSDVPNGLTAANPGAAVIRTGIHTGAVDVTIRLEQAPPPALAGWEEAEEIELITQTGDVRISGLMAGISDDLPNLTPQGPGWYGMRVHARGRDIAPTKVPKVPFEFYLIVVWPIDVGPDAAERLGVGVAEELGLPAKEVRRPPGKHLDPRDEPGRRVRDTKPRLPHFFRGRVGVADHCLRIFNPFQDTSGTPHDAEDLVAAAPDSIVIRTLKRTGAVGFWIHWEPAAPQHEIRSWESHQDVEFVTRTGVMHVAGLPADERPNLTPQGAGRYGLRVYGRTRQLGPGVATNEPKEAYLLQVWPVSLGWTESRDNLSGSADVSDDDDD